MERVCVCAHYRNVIPGSYIFWGVGHAWPFFLTPSVSLSTQASGQGSRCHVIQYFKQQIWPFLPTMWKKPSSNVTLKLHFNDQTKTGRFFFTTQTDPRKKKSKKSSTSILSCVSLLLTSAIRVQLPYLPCRSDRRGWKHLSHKQTACLRSAAAGPWWNCDTRPSETEKTKVTWRLTLPAFPSLFNCAERKYVNEWMCVRLWTCGRKQDENIPFGKVRCRFCRDRGCFWLPYASLSSCKCPRLLVWTSRSFSEERYRRK